MHRAAPLSDELFRSALCCPRCRGGLLEAAAHLSCASCDASYELHDGIPALVATATGDDAHAAFYSEADPERHGRSGEGMPEPFASEVRNFVAGVPAGGVVVEIGSGRGAFSGIHPGYVATDYSLFALRAYSHGRRVQADVEALPFRTGSIDAFFSVATLEHIPQPELALAEIARCLRPGGSALLYPAWYVRPWAAKALTERSYASLPIGDRVRKGTIPVRDTAPWWFAKLLPGRIGRELAIRAGRQLDFRYRRLSPNLDEYLTSDSDAFTSMDPHAVASYFISRGYRDLRRPRPVRRLLYGYEAVVIRKPDDRP